MEKIMRSFLMAMMLLAGSTVALAQDEVDNTFRFIDKLGNEIPDGSTYTIMAKNEELIPGSLYELQATFDLDVENTTDDAACVAARIITESMSSGTLQFCFPISCPPNVPYDYTSDTYKFAAGEKKDLASEWYPEEGEYGTATFTLQLLVMEEISPLKYEFKAYGPKITLNCIYADPAGINDVTVSGNETVNVYDMTGRAVITAGSVADVSALGKGTYVCEVLKGGRRIATKKIMR